MDFTYEMPNTVRNPESAEEFFALENENYTQASEGGVMDYSEKTHATVELSDDDLGNVTGGRERPPEREIPDNCLICDSPKLEKTRKDVGRGSYIVKMKCPDCGWEDTWQFFNR